MQPCKTCEEMREMLKETFRRVTSNFTDFRPAAKQELMAPTMESVTEPANEVHHFDIKGFLANFKRHHPPSPSA